MHRGNKGGEPGTERPGYAVDGAHQLEGTDSCHRLVWNKYADYTNVGGPAVPPDMRS